MFPNPVRNRFNRIIPNSKRNNSYPAVKIGRLGVNKNYGNKGIGAELMDFIKTWFVSPLNKTGCRFILVDSYNEQKPLNYYKKCKFLFLCEDEQTEKEIMNIPDDEKLETRAMYFDLLPWQNYLIANNLI